MYPVKLFLFQLDTGRLIDRSFDCVLADLANHRLTVEKIVLYLYSLFCSFIICSMFMVEVIITAHSCRLGYD